jgi:predicted ATPase
MPFLSQISLSQIQDNSYLKNIPSLSSGIQLKLKNNVTFFVGENGSGKSTLLEGIASHCGFSLRGGNRNHNLSGTRIYESILADHLRLSWSPRRINNGFFMRAESFFNFASYVDDLASTDPAILKAYGGRSLLLQPTSPMLICYPGATIYEFSSEGVAETTYQKTEHYNLTKLFLDNPSLYLRHLLSS